VPWGGGFAAARGCTFIPIFDPKVEGLPGILGLWKKNRY